MYVHPFLLKFLSVCLYIHASHKTTGPIAMKLDIIILYYILGITLGFFLSQKYTYTIKQYSTITYNTYPQRTLRCNCGANVVHVYRRMQRCATDLAAIRHKVCLREDNPKRDKKR